jgi:hypothetical protein
LKNSISFEGFTEVLESSLTLNYFFFDGCEQVLDGSSRYGTQTVSGQRLPEDKRRRTKTVRFSISPDEVCTLLHLLRRGDQDIRL